MVTPNAPHEFKVGNKPPGLSRPIGHMAEQVSMEDKNPTLFQLESNLLDNVSNLRGHTVQYRFISSIKVLNRCLVRS